MSIRHKAQFPVPGCIVEFLQGNSPIIAYVLEVQNERVRLYTHNKKEMKLPPARLLPWFGPAVSPSLNRAEIDSLLEEHQKKRQTLKEALAMEELWQLAEGEIQRASAGWFASLVFDDPDIDGEAAMGHALLDFKTHFKFSPPDFEIYPLETMEKRVEEAKAAQLRETLALHGNKFFHKLWEVHLGKGTLHKTDIPEPDLAKKLEDLLHAIMADAESNDSLWKLLSRGLPNDPHLPLHLAVAWGVVPHHYNYLLDKAGYDATDSWFQPYAEGMEAISSALAVSLEHAGPALNIPFVTIDPDSTIDRDDAFFVELDDNGNFLLHIAIACPSLVWPFGTPLDREVVRRATSLYLPEGDLHMLPAEIGCALFSLDSNRTALALVTSLRFDAHGNVLDTNIAVQPVSAACNMTLREAEFLLAGKFADKHTMSSINMASANVEPINMESGRMGPIVDSSGESMSFEQLLEQSEATPAPDTSDKSLPIPTSYREHSAMLATAYTLATLLQNKRLQNGAVILERPDCEVSLVPLDHGNPPHPSGDAEPLTPSAVSALSPDTKETPATDSHPANMTSPQGLTKQDTCLVQVVQSPATPKAHRIIGELMIAANAAMGQWGVDHDIPLLYRNQDIALPPEYSAVWQQPHDIAKVARSLPAASLETLPRKHTGLGIYAYATCTSPMRRYVDLLNQGQIIAHLRQKELPHNAESLSSLLPLLQARLDSVGHIQRTRPRYWKLLFFRQQGDKAWWPGIVTEENNAFVTVALPWAQMMVRGRRKLFDEKITPGAHVMIRVGKVYPLQNEITLLEVLEQ